ncbi:thioredoxin reductase 2-like, partial [Trifolium medium]|nr:thioredoxin reductase 2-like [Trifolium medium]
MRIFPNKFFAKARNIIGIGLASAATFAAASSSSAATSTSSSDDTDSSYYSSSDQSNGRKLLKTKLCIIGSGPAAH